MKTVNDITKSMRDIKAMGHGVANNIIERIDVNIIAHFGNIPCLTILCENIVPYGHYNDIVRLGFLLKALVEFFGVDREDGVWLSSLKNIPCRLVFEGEGDTHWGEKAIGIGHFMKDKFILFEDLGKLAEESEDTE